MAVMVVSNERRLGRTVWNLRQIYDAVKVALGPNSDPAEHAQCTPVVLRDAIVEIFNGRNTEEAPPPSLRCSGSGQIHGDPTSQRRRR